MTDPNNSDTNLPPPSEDSIPETSQPNNHNIANEEQAPVPKMTDRKRPADLPPTPEDSIPKIPRNNIEDVVNEEQALALVPGSPKTKVTIADLEQIYINWIAEKMVDPRTLGRLQQTCKSLDVKGAEAERFVTFYPYKIKYTRPQTPQDKIGSVTFHHRGFTLDEAQFKARKFRLRAGALRIKAEFTPEICQYVAELLKGRGTIKMLNLYYFSSTVDAIDFNKFIQNFHISQLTCADMPVDYLDQPSLFTKLEKLVHFGYFPVPLRFFAFTANHSGSISYLTFDFYDLNLILRKWANKEKVIKALSLFHHHGDYDIQQEIIFAGWRIVSAEEEMPPERPLVIRYSELEFRLIRSDESTLCIDIVNGLFDLFHQPRDDEMEQFSDVDSDVETVAVGDDDDDDDDDYEDEDDNDDDDNDDD